MGELNKDKIKNLYQEIKAPKELMQKTLENIPEENNNRNNKADIIFLAMKLGLSAAASIGVVLLIDSTGKQGAVEVPDGVASVFSNSSAYVVGAGIFVICALFFIAQFVKKKN